MVKWRMFLIKYSRLVCLLMKICLSNFFFVFYLFLVCFLGSTTNTLVLLAASLVPKMFLFVYFSPRANSLNYSNTEFLKELFTDIGCKKLFLMVQNVYVVHIFSWRRHERWFIEQKHLLIDCSRIFIYHSNVFYPKAK